ncbi:unnamed protein product [Didymodactylos carnosus]|uniref:Uncharacterized protein n=1 Tax=Didymodactylos carnosus TaxID=1234261 RepID=A0A813W8Q1_9BILA|nr:unnamed protein product [Didymodactylos carnosus]CAF3645226.1 unnamed protein product [Didymodactylos carnosus]
MSSSNSSCSTGSCEICDGENLAVILALYWVIYLVINALIFAGALYALRKCFEKSSDDGKKINPEQLSRTSSRQRLVKSTHK